VDFSRRRSCQLINKSPRNAYPGEACPMLKPRRSSTVPVCPLTALRVQGNKETPAHGSREATRVAVARDYRVNGEEVVTLMQEIIFRRSWKGDPGPNYAPHSVGEMRPSKAAGRSSFTRRIRDERQQNCPFGPHQMRSWWKGDLQAGSKDE
jgi:hypothetical protein